MSKLRCHITISLDGFVAGPNQSQENPLGEGGEALHDWVVQLGAWRQAHGAEGGEANELSWQWAHGCLRIPAPRVPVPD